MKHFMAVYLCLFFIFAITFTVYAQSEEDKLIKQQLEATGINDVDTKVRSITGTIDLELGNDFSFKEFLTDILNGNVKLSPKEIFSAVMKSLFKEIYSLFSIIQKLIFVGILSAVLKTMNTSFSGKSVNELSFYVCYIVLVMIIMSAFGTGINMVSTSIDGMISYMQAVIPFFTALLASGGYIGAVTVVAPLAVGGCGIMAGFIENFILPAIGAVAILEMVNFISDKGILTKLSELFKNVIGWGLKGSAIAFMAIISLGRIGNPDIGRIIGKTTKAAIGAVPVVGDVMSGAVETAAAITGTIKNGAAVAAVVFIIIISLMPLLKLFAMIFIYKFAAAVMEPICEKRLVRCISTAGDFSVLLMGALFSVQIMFAFSVIILVASA